MWEYDQSRFKATRDHLAETGGCQVDYIVLVNGEPKVLVEAESPSVMKKVGELLPSHGIKLRCVHHEPLVEKILAKVSTLFLLVAILILRRNV